MRKRSELIFSALQIPVDYFMLIFAFVLAYFVREGSGKPFSIIVSGYDYLKFMLIFLPLWLVIFGTVGLYQLKTDRSKWLDFGRIFAACAAGVMILILIDFLRVNPIFPAKSIPVYGFVFAVLLVSLGRLIILLLQRLAAKRGVGVYKVVFIGSGQPAIEIKSALKKYKYSYKIVKNITSLEYLDFNNLRKMVSDNQIDQIFVADTVLNEDKIVSLIDFSQRNHIRYQFAPTLAGLYTSRITPSEIGSIPILEIQPTPLEGWGRIAKRIFDVFVTTIITVISLPIQIVIALAIKITDSGPVFYLHECYGRGGRKINVYKFRTLKSEYSIGPRFGGRTIEDVLKKLTPAQRQEFKETAKLRNDPRVSRIGRFLRKTSLDELPQLFNVLKGDLSLVGPRPLPESELKLAGGHETLDKILAIRPGITGLWQVSGRNDLKYSDRVKLNIYYLENWSLWLDITILFKTFWQTVVIRNGL